MGTSISTWQKTAIVSAVARSYAKYNPVYFQVSLMLDKLSIYMESCKEFGLVFGPKLKVGSYKIQLSGIFSVQKGYRKANESMKP